MREPWTSRTFAFDFPVERIAVLLSRLRSAAPRLREATRALTNEALRTRDGERWSIQEHVGHLRQLDGLWLQRVDELARGAETLSAADMSNQATWNADYNARAFGDVFDAFVARRNELLAKLQALDADGLARAGLHPRLQQPMRAVDVAFFAAEHDDHHIALVEELAPRMQGAPASPTSMGWHDLPNDAPMQGLERRRAVGREAMISHITLHQGCEVPVHAHHNEQFACVLSGRVAFTLADGDERVLAAGEVLHLPSHAPHGARALETSVVLDVFAPPSEATGIDG
ncbi:MAG: DinB family protein [Planctomycetes bacterium]|nr:DinB family protein [Planctomycetota bacterium]